MKPIKSEDLARTFHKPSATTADVTASQSLPLPADLRGFQSRHPSHHRSASSARPQRACARSAVYAFEVRVV